MIRLFDWLRGRPSNQSALSNADLRQAAQDGPDLHQLAIDTLAAKGTPFAAALAAEIDRGRQRRNVGHGTREAGPRIEDTTRSATLAEYVAWLRGYIARGGSPTHFYEHPFPVGSFRFAESDVVIDSDREFGADSRHVILARGVTAVPSNPEGAFGGWGHTEVYAMDGYRLVAGFVVPAYSDPEIEALLTREYRVAREARRVRRAARRAEFGIN